jgi:hypothetical protein
MKSTHVRIKGLPVPMPARHYVDKANGADRLAEPNDACRNQRCNDMPV